MLRREANKGFTLIEVMAAVAVFAIAASGLYTINQQNILIADRLQNKTLAQWVAMNSFNRLSLDEILPAVGNIKTNEEMAGQRWQAENRITETPITTVRRVTVMVYNESGQLHAQMDGFVGERKAAELNAYQ